MAKMRFRASQSKVMFDYPKAEALSGDADRIVFLSQRDFYLLLNSIEFIGKFRNRVYTGHIDEIYDICSDEQWDIFKGWVEDLENNLGGWPVSNQHLADIVKTNRMIVAALMGQAINFDSEPLPNAINYEQGVRQAILGIGGALDNGMTLQEMKDLIDDIDLTGTDFIDTLTDIAQILAFLFLVFGPDERVVVAMGWWDKFTLKRWQHNNLTIQSHQATSLRGIMRAITPFKDDSEDDEKTLWETIGSIPWLARAVVAIAEPSPGGEIALIATTMGGLINNMYQLVKTAWGLFFNKWINLIEDPEPVDTLTGALGIIANKISTREDMANNPAVSITNRLDVIAEALEGLEGKDLEPVLNAIEDVLGGSYEPEG